jgi:hypothetical protein
MELMIERVESDLCVSVEECEEDNSFWIPTPALLIEEEGHFGIIEIGDQQSEFEKIVSLAHEVGHSILHAHPDFGNYEEVIFKEAVAWYLGYNYFVEQGWTIHLGQYKARASLALEKYVRSLNAKH